MVDLLRGQLGLQVVKLMRLCLLLHQRHFVVGPERLLDLIRLVHKIQNEGVFLAGSRAVQPRQRLHGLHVRQPLVDVHRVQQRLVEARLVLLGDDQNLVLVGREPLGSSFSLMPRFIPTSVYSSPTSSRTVPENATSVLMSV